ncbi:nucleoside deaminase [Myxococcota bacterium]|nr:nucleoside deaminase [Myxococcota bacterium]
MEMALEEARRALEEDEIPVGAVLFQGERFLARAHNRTRGLGDPTAHAEVLAMRMAMVRHGAAAVRGATLWVTMEPCPMCAGALVLAKVGRVVYGCEDPKAGAASSLFTILADDRLNHRCRVQGGIAAEEAASLLRTFFEKRRSRPRRAAESGIPDPER